MSPTVFRTQNLRFVIYPKDHPPPHVHVIGPNLEAKFEIETQKLISAQGFTFQDLRGIQSLIKQNQDYFLEEWYEWQ